MEQSPVIGMPTAGFPIQNFKLSEEVLRAHTADAGGNHSLSDCSPRARTMPTFGDATSEPMTMHRELIKVYSSTRCRLSAGVDHIAAICVNISFAVELNIKPVALSASYERGRGPRHIDVPLMYKSIVRAFGLICQEECFHDSRRYISANQHLNS